MNIEELKKTISDMGELKKANALYKAVSHLYMKADKSLINDILNTGGTPAELMMLFLSGDFDFVEISQDYIKRLGLTDVSDEDAWEVLGLEITNLIAPKEDNRFLNPIKKILKAIQEKTKPQELEPII